MNNKLKCTFTSMICLFGISAAAIGSDSCVETKYGKCFSTHARFAVYTGDGMETLWPVGTHRLLWPASGTGPLDRLVGDRPGDVYVFGDFVVCPLMKDIPGEMRHVCIQTMKNLKLVRRSH